MLDGEAALAARQVACSDGAAQHALGGAWGSTGSQRWRKRAPTLAPPGKRSARRDADCAALPAVGRPGRWVQGQDFQAEILRQMREKQEAAKRKRQLKSRYRWQAAGGASRVAGAWRSC